LFVALIASCTGSIRPDISAQTDRQYLKCRTIQADNRQGQRMLKCSFGFDQCNLFTATGKKLAIEAESGEKLELSWTVDWLGQGKVFPHWLFSLEYVRPDGIGGWLPPVRIGECHFNGGCNYGEFLAPDANGNGVPDFFAQISWESWDYGNDEGIPDHLVLIRHLYVRETDRYTAIRYLYRYPDGCSPPLNLSEDVCRIRTACKPPYEPAGEELMESRLLHSPAERAKTTVPDKYR
jgi:hypothetical protein